MSSVDLHPPHVLALTTVACELITGRRPAVTRTPMLPGRIGDAGSVSRRGLVPGAKVEVARLDLAELATVRDFAARALDKGFPLDVLINNAGEQAVASGRACQCVL